MGKAQFDKEGDITDCTCRTAHSDKRMGCEAKGTGAVCSRLAPGSPTWSAVGAAAVAVTCSSMEGIGVLQPDSLSHHTCDEYFSFI